MNKLQLNKISTEEAKQRILNFRQKQSTSSTSTGSSSTGSLGTSLEPYFNINKLTPKQELKNKLINAINNKNQVYFEDTTVEDIKEVFVYLDEIGDEADVEISQIIGEHLIDILGFAGISALLKIFELSGQLQDNALLQIPAYVKLQALMKNRQNPRVIALGARDGIFVDVPVTRKVRIPKPMPSWVMEIQ